MKYLIPVLIVVSLCMCLLNTVFSSGAIPATPSKELEVSGNVDVDDTELSFRIPGRVIQRQFSEGETIEEGQVVARLDEIELSQELSLRQAEREVYAAALSELLAGSRPEEIAQAEAAVGRVNAQLSELLAGTRTQEIEVAKAALYRAKTDASNSAVELVRQSRLFEKNAISNRDLDNAKAASDMAQARLAEAEARFSLAREGPRKEQIEAARNSLNEFRERLALIRHGPRAEAIAQAKARLELASRAIDLARTRMENCVLNSPISGVVLSHNIEPGEFVSPGTPVITVADLRKVWIRAFIPETDLPLVKLGQKVVVSCDTFSEKKYEGKITFISAQAEFTPMSIQTHEERVKLVYRIKIDVRNPDQELKPGMPVDAAIQLDPSF